MIFAFFMVTVLKPLQSRARLTNRKPITIRNTARTKIQSGFCELFTGQSR